MSTTTTTKPTRRTARRVPLAYSYGVLRFADWWAAHRDANNADPDIFGRRLAHTRWENDTRLLVAVEDRLSGVVQEIKALQERLRTAVEVEAPPTPRDDLIHRGEAHLPAEAVRARRAREHAAEVCAVADRNRRVRKTRHALADRLTELRAVVADEWELACNVSERLRHYYLRRMTTYARVLARRGIQVQIPSFEPAAWTTQPCPWIEED